MYMYKMVKVTYTDGIQLNFFTISHCLFTFQINTGKDELKGWANKIRARNQHFTVKKTKPSLTILLLINNRLVILIFVFFTVKCLAHSFNSSLPVLI